MLWKFSIISLVFSMTSIATVMSSGLLLVLLPRGSYAQDRTNPFQHNPQLTYAPRDLGQAGTIRNPADPANFNQKKLNSDTQRQIQEQAQFAATMQPWINSNQQGYDGREQLRPNIPQAPIPPQPIPQQPIAQQPIAQQQPNIAPPQYNGNSVTNNNFYSNLFAVLAAGNLNRNLLFSPLSLQTILAMTSFGATGQTEQQIQTALSMPRNKQEAEADYKRLLSLQQSTPNSKLIMANKMYFAKNLGSVKPAFQTTAQQVFGSKIEGIEFRNPVESAGLINAWVAGITGQRITDLVSADSLSPDTQAILVNAIYFKGKWANEFSKMDTTKRDFRSGQGFTRQVDMMYNDDIFRYAEIPQLDAKILELPYLNSTMTMTFILPNRVEGLRELEQNLARWPNWDALWTQLRPEQVEVRIPKFTINCDLDMVDPLRALGIINIFSGNAELPNILRGNAKVQISKIQHRAVIDVNEAGSEATAATFAKFVPLSLPLQQKTFTADHPFIYMVRSPETVHFIGHLVH